jgi:plastocyanin
MVHVHAILPRRAAAGAVALLQRRLAIRAVYSRPDRNSSPGISEAPPSSGSAALTGGFPMHPFLNWRFPTLLSLLALSLTACNSRPAPAVKDGEIAIDNFTFTPATITVPRGTTITWINRDDVPHTVVANDGRFHSAALDTDDRYSHAFTEPGTYPYFCGVHPHMTGQVIVK